ncbi:MAG: hypothetical protein FWH52_06640 [Synergistaceae bacterium]|nr:hypothetical protein [Synergistaceae bacterium]
MKPGSNVEITKAKMGRLLYCLNWHIKDLSKEASTDHLSETEKELFRKRTMLLRALKTRVLAKLIVEGHASLRGVQISFHNKKKYYSIMLNRDFYFHAPLKECKEVIEEYEKAGIDTSSIEAQMGNIQFLFTGSGI